MFPALVCAALAAQSWPTFFSAYQDGLEAQKRGDHALASRAFARAIALEPQPGARVKTYGLNFLARYYPYLRLAESSLAQGDLAGAETALGQSAARGVEPAQERDALLARLHALRKSKESAAPSASTPARTPAPEPQATGKPLPNLATPPGQTVAGPPAAPVATPAGTRPAEPRPTEPHPAGPKQAGPQQAGPQQAGSAAVPATSGQPGEPSTRQALTTGRPVGTGTGSPGTGAPSQGASGPTLADPNTAGQARTNQGTDGRASANPSNNQPPTLPADERQPSAPRWHRWGPALFLATLAGAAFAWLFVRRKNRPPGQLSATLVPDAAQGAFLGNSLGNALGASLAPSQAGVYPPRPGSRTEVAVGQSSGLAFGPYTAYRVLGRGGCATAYFGLHAETGAEVAIKVPHPHLAEDMDFRTRFRREASLGALLDHPRIVRIVDPGPAEGELWIAMTFIRGTTLEAHLAETGPQPVAHAVTIARDIAQAIAHAHARGVVHRDLKPANIMLNEQGAVVMDFGIARMLDAAMTTNTMFLGTPLYAAPESILGARVGPPADRYALGLILFEMLVGSPPFDGESPFAILEAQRSEPLPDLAAACPEAPPRLVRLVERLCAKAPDERPEDMELLDILQEMEASLNP